MRILKKLRRLFCGRDRRRKGPHGREYGGPAGHREGNPFAGRRHERRMQRSFRFDPIRHGWGAEDAALILNPEQDRFAEPIRGAAPVLVEAAARGGLGEKNCPLSSPACPRGARAAGARQR